MHEMGQPLFCIRTFTESLLESDLPSWAIKRLKQIKLSNELISYKLMDVMDNNHLQHGTISISKNSFKVRSTIMSVCGLLRAQASNKQVELKLNLKIQPTLHLTSDAKRIQ